MFFLKHVYLVNICFLEILSLLFHFILLHVDYIDEAGDSEVVRDFQIPKLYSNTLSCDIEVKSPEFSVIFKLNYPKYD